MSPEPKAPKLDISGNRTSIKWSGRELAARAVWEYLGSPIFRLVPRPFWSIRASILRHFGAEIGKDVHVHPSVRIAIPWNLSIGDESSVGDRAILYALGSVRLGARVTISQGAHLCAGSHDYRDPLMLLVKAKICINDDAWVCADAFIGPDVVVGSAAIIGARAVVVSDVAPNAIMVGNPARKLRDRDAPIA